MQQITCNHASLISAALSLGDKCEQISAACADQQEMFNFFKLYLCHLNANNVIFAFIAIFLAVFLTKFIIAVVDEYMAPAIVNLCDFFRMSEALAGVTLIAFANGLAEVITVLVVSDSPAGDVSYTIGTLYGTGLFILSLVIAMAIHVSPKPIKVFPSTIYRDLLFYIIATLMIIFMAYTGKVTWVSGLLMLCLYVLLVVLVVVQDIMDKKKDDNALINKDEEENSQSNIQKFEEIKAKLTENEIVQLKKAFNVTLNYVKHKAALKKENRNVLDKILDAIEYPFHIVRMLTIPTVEEEHYDHRKTIIWPVFGVIFMLWAIFLTPTANWLYTIPVSTGLIFTFLIFRPNKDDQLPKYFIILNCISIVNCVLWTRILCGVFVDLLTFVGVLTNLSNTYLGLTVLAMVNSLSDGLTTIAIAKRGRAVMGITGSIAACLFGLLVGFGLSMFKKTVQQGEPEPFTLFDPSQINENALTLSVLFVAMVVLLLIFFYAIFNNFVLDAKLGGILKMTYMCFMVCATFTAFYKAFN